MPTQQQRILFELERLGLSPHELHTAEEMRQAAHNLKRGLTATGASPNPAVHVPTPPKPEHVAPKAPDKSAPPAKPPVQPPKPPVAEADVDLEANQMVSEGSPVAAGNTVKAVLNDGKNVDAVVSADKDKKAKKASDDAAKKVVAPKAKDDDVAADVAKAASSKPVPEGNKSQA